MDESAETVEASRDASTPMGECWVLFRPLASEVPDSVRYRALLKAALRTHGLKAVRVSGVGPGEILAEAANSGLPGPGDR
jgi:hypothetical protein